VFFPGAPMRETGVVISRQGDLVQVQMTKGERCGECNICHVLGPGHMVIEADNGIDAKIGDVVDVEIEPQKVLTYSFLLFVFPILMMIAGYYAGRFISDRFGGSGDLFAILSSFCGLLLSLVFLRMCDRRIRKRGKSSARVMRVQKPEKMKDHIK
jgi:sigma-E factor negative regulatory protein RseC